LPADAFQNALVVDWKVERAEAVGFTVLRHRQGPLSDDELSLGEAVVAGAVAL